MLPVDTSFMVVKASHLSIVHRQRRKFLLEAK